MIARQLVIHGSMLLGFLCTALTFADSQEKQEAPPDFSIVAQYSPGFSSWKGWRSTINSEGKVVQDIYGGKENRKHSTLSASDLRALYKQVTEANFYQLKQRYDFAITDLPTLKITVTMNKKSHSVEVYAPSQLQENEEVRRFLNVWSEILARVPSPNPDQKPMPRKS